MFTKYRVISFAGKAGNLMAYLARCQKLFCQLCKDLEGENRIERDHIAYIRKN